MADLAVRIQNLATRIGTEFKTVRTEVDGKVGTLASLTTTAKTNLVAAVNELDAAIDAIGTPAAIADGSTALTTTWSSTKISGEITAAYNAIVGGAAAALDTLAELATALGGDANFSATVTTALGNRVRYDAAQTLSAGQKTQACANIGIGEPDTDFVATFNAALI